MNLKKAYSSWLTNRYQLVVRDKESLAEKTKLSFSYAKLTCWCIILLVILVAGSLKLSTTILAKWLDPAYIEQENKKELIQLAKSVEALEQQTNQQKKFIDLLQSIIAGKEPPGCEFSNTKKELSKKEMLPYTPEQLAAADVQLRDEFETSESTLYANNYNKPVNDLQELFFFPPANGIITTPFKKEIGHYGVDIVSNENEPIKCTADGVVIFAAWTVETGWVMVVQHNTDLISVYKHNAALFKKVGNFVKAGDIIAMMGNSGELSTGPHLHFELWYAGIALNPEHFIPF